MTDVKQISESDYNAVAGADWPSYEDFQKGKVSIKQEIIDEIIAFIGTTKEIYNQ